MKILRFFFVCVLFLFIGCEHKQPEYRTYEQEIVGFIENSADGRELFSTEIYPAKSFYMDDTLLVFYKIDSIDREYSYLNISSSPREIYIYKSIYDAMVTMDDYFYGNLFGIINNDTVKLSRMESRIKRSAYFLKLFENSYPYKGWIFWGYACNAPLPGGSFSSQQGVEFAPVPGDVTPPGRDGMAIYQKDNIIRLGPNDSLTYSSDSAMRIFAKSNSSDRDVFSAQYNGSHYVTGWRLSSDAQQFYNLMTFDMPINFRFDTTFIDSIDYIVDTSILKVDDYIMPYKMDI